MTEIIERQVVKNEKGLKKGIKAFRNRFNALKYRNYMLAASSRNQKKTNTLELNLKPTD